MIDVNFYDCSFEPDSKLTYSVILPRFKGKWIFVRHRGCTTWEMPGGHIEAGESSEGAAKRELFEETGASGFTIVCIATYSVTSGDRTGWGRLYLAEVPELADIPDTDEIEEIKFVDNLPGNLTYPEIQSEFYKKIRDLL